MRINETSARRLKRAAQHSVLGRMQKEQEFNYSNYSDNKDLTQLRDNMLLAYKRTQHAIELAELIPDKKDITAKDAIIMVQRHTIEESLNLMEEICDVISEEQLSQEEIEKKNKQFLDADKRANVVNRVYRKASQKLDNVSKNPENYSKEEIKKAMTTVREIQNRLSDLQKAANKKNKEQQELKNSGVSGVVSREFESRPKKAGSYRYARVLKTNESLQLVKEARGLLSSIFEVSQEKRLEAAKNSIPGRTWELVAAKKFGDAKDRKIARERLNYAKNLLLFSPDELKKFRDLHKKEKEKVVIDPEPTPVPVGKHKLGVPVKLPPFKNESLKLIEEAYGLMTSLFEVDNVEDYSKEQNKLSREAKGENGNKVDVVSVEDELFPYAGNAKQQFNQKVIAKINDMIEGKATLEDLIQLVRSKGASKKLKESLDEKFEKVFILADKILGKE